MHKKKNKRKKKKTNLKLMDTKYICTRALLYDIINNKYSTLLYCFKIR